jgi:hypothetical protein
MSKKLAAEFLGTFWLVLGGCGSAVLAAAFPQVGIGLLGVSLAFGLTVLTAVYALGPVSGGHFNPAVSFGLWAAGRFRGEWLLPYIAAQLGGAIVAAGVLYVIASGQPDFSLADGFAANGYGEHSPGGYSLLAAFVCELVMTRAGGLCRHRDRTGAHADTSHQHSGDEHFRESGAQHGACVVRHRLGRRTALAFLVGSDRRRHGSRIPLQAALRQERGARVARLVAIQASPSPIDRPFVRRA